MNTYARVKGLTDQDVEGWTAMRLCKAILTTFAVTALTACGGGGGGEAGSSSFGSGSGGTGTGTGTGTGGGAPATPVAERLVIELNKSSAINSGSDTVVATATATSTGGQTVAGVPVTFTVDANALYTPSSTTTSVQGVTTATVSIGSDRSNRVVTVTALSGTLKASASFAVTGSKLKGTPVPATVLPGSAGNKVDFRLTDANDNPMAGQAISVTAGSAGSSSGVTGTNGDFSYTYTAPVTTGALNVVASAGGITNTQTIQVQSSSNTVPAVTTPILSASVAANPIVVGTNSDATNNRVEIRALFLGANNAPVRNVRVRFDLDDDVNSIGGVFSTGSNIVYSDANGVATTAYIPGSRSSPTGGLTIRACYDSVDFTTCNPSKVAKAAITVVSEPLSVTIGTDDKVGEGPSTLTYIANFVVLVVDASGKAKANVAIEPSIDLVTYFKGQYFLSSSATGGPVAPWTAVSAECTNEDVNRNGVLEISADPTASEDKNHSGSIEPRKSDVAVSVVGSASTDSSGIVKLQIEYPKNIANWLIVKITVGAGVSGTEGRATWTERLRVPASAINATTSPAFELSPYGLVTTPQVLRLLDSNGRPLTYPDGSPRTTDSLNPCSNPY